MPLDMAVNLDRLHRVCPLHVADWVGDRIRILKFPLEAGGYLRIQGCHMMKRKPLCDAPLGSINVKRKMQLSPLHPGYDRH